jgi:hypothetical protein
MSNLRVTDVQSALRHFSDIGHDVLTDPRAIHLDSQRYGQAVGHHLIIGGSQRRSNQLNSYIAQSEVPIITNIGTSSEPGEGGTFDGHRYVVSQKPLNIPHSKKSGEHTSVFHQNVTFDEPGYREDTKGSIAGISPFWTPTTNVGHTGESYNDIHEAIKAHTSPDFPSSPYMTSKEFSKDFNTREAFNHLSFGKPFEGLVTVHNWSDAKNAYYHYNPETEQLTMYNR